MIRSERVLACLVALLVAGATGPNPAGAVRRGCATVMHGGDGHERGSLHGHACGIRRVASLLVSEAGGLGQVEVRGRTAAVLQRDEGTVAVLDMRRPTQPKVLGRYDDDAQESLDGDLAFADGGRWLFYARQTENFSKDGIHVLDISDPSAPSLAFYQPQGGTFRIAYYRDDAGEWVISLDATHGLVINRFESTTGALVPVHVDPVPALRRVGGPASAGIFVDARDARTDKPLLYTTSGTRGLDVYNLSDPAAPALLGSWDEIGLADLEVHDTARKRIVYAATEYWFATSTRPQVVRLDATKLDDIKMARSLYSAAPDDLWRVQGIERLGNSLFVAGSHAGVMELDPAGGTMRGLIVTADERNDGARATSAPYAMDVEVSGRHLLSTDAASGRLSVLCASPCR